MPYISGSSSKCRWPIGKRSNRNNTGNIFIVEILHHQEMPLATWELVKVSAAKNNTDADTFADYAELVPQHQFMQCQVSSVFLVVEPSKILFLI